MREVGTLEKSATPDCMVWIAVQDDRPFRALDLPQCLGSHGARVDARHAPLQALRRVLSKAHPAPFHVVVTERAASAEAQDLLLYADDVLFVDDFDWVDELRRSVSDMLNAALRVQQLEGLGRLIGGSAAMRKLRKEIAFACSTSDANVLIEGETGTGKRVVAEVLHEADAERSVHPFHSMDCGAVVPGLLGSELFGHQRGAFTGASVARAGAFYSAGQGTLLLDELGELDLALQPSLLTALQQRSYRPVGSDVEQPIRCRVLSATNRSLERMVQERRFRDDLLYRLAQITIRLPALRDRREDIPGLCESILLRLGHRTPPRLSDDVLAVFQRWPFGGNVRELEAILRHAMTRVGTAAQIRLSHLPEPMRHSPLAAGSASPGDPGPSETEMSLEAQLEVVRREIVERALSAAEKQLQGGDRTAHVSLAARQLQISARSLYNYLSGRARH